MRMFISVKISEHIYSLILFKSNRPLRFSSLDLDVYLDLRLCSKFVTAKLHLIPALPLCGEFDPQYYIQFETGIDHPITCFVLLSEIFNSYLMDIHEKCLKKQNNNFSALNLINLASEDVSGCLLVFYS